MTTVQFPYEQAHYHLRRDRGRAAEFACTMCGQPARDWALLAGRDHQTDDRGRTYSTNVDDYAPMCRPCHTAYDTEHGNRDQKRASDLGAAARTEWWADPEHRAEKAELCRQRNAIMFRCAECGRVNSAAHLGRHQQVSGHAGREAVA